MEYDVSLCINCAMCVCGMRHVLFSFNNVVHVHKKYPGCGKYRCKAEEDRWVKNIRKKLNSHIRYRRRVSKSM